MGGITASSLCCGDRRCISLRRRPEQNQSVILLHLLSSLLTNPSPQQTDEYKALMARLRRDDEERKYQRMVSSSGYPNTGMPSLAQQFSTSSLAHSFAEVHRPSNKADEGDDDVTYNDVHRQVMLLINFLVTIFGCAATLWILARWWSTPARLFLTMGGSLIVAIAEVGVYQAYIWHLSDAKKKDGKLKEVKEVVETWVVGKEDEAADVESRDLHPSKRGEADDGTKVRLRKANKREET